MEEQEDKIIITAKGVDYEVKPLVFVDEQTLAPMVKFIVVMDEETEDYIEIGRMPMLITEESPRSEKEVLDELAVSLRMQLSLRAKKVKK